VVSTFVGVDIVFDYLSIDVQAKIKYVRTIIKQNKDPST
jgi:hypothetical protein